MDPLIDAYGRVHGEVERVLDGLGPDALAFRPDPRANSIAWLIWHLTRVQDSQLSDAFGHGQLWLQGDWRERFALPFADQATGYGHSSDEVAAVRASAELLADYHAAVHQRIVDDLRGTTAADLDRIVDTRWNPPVTLGVRLVSVLEDSSQHVGQAAYVRGLAERAGMD